MKKIERLKLNQLSISELEKKQMNPLKGGDSCDCTCTSGLTYGMSELQGYMNGRCNDKMCICGCDPFLVETLANNETSNASIM